MRDHILSEIRRIASANGGKAPGRQRFEKETGIARSAWYGTYWARWGDAVREAGLDANERQSRIANETLLQHLAASAREFGGLPTYGEMRLFMRSRPAAPSWTTFENRFPTKADMAEALRGWAETSPENSDIIPLLPAVVLTAAPLNAVRKGARQDGYVYLIKSGDFYKIGRSDELERRVKEIRLALPEKAELAHVIRTDDPPGIEAYWHRRFADRRANGEWFKLTPSEVGAFRRRKFQ